MEVDHTTKSPPQILIVDDVDVNVEILDNIISQEGYGTLCALKVQDAIELIRKTKPSLILSDISMPEIDGFEFCRMLKNNPKTRDIPVIFVTALSSEEKKKKAFMAGAVDYIPKPVDAVETIMRVNNHLSAYHMKQQMGDYNRLMHKMVEEQKRHLENGQKNMLLALVGIMERRQPYMRKHLDNVGFNSRILAQALQFLPEYESVVTDEFVDCMDTAAKLHNIGSIVVPEKMYPNGQMPGETNRDYIQMCTEEGGKIIEDINGNNGDSLLLQMAERITRCHHAHWDGQGSPPLKEKEIPLEARITLLANDYDILTAGRDGTGGVSAQEAKTIINEKSGLIYDPDIVQIFNKIQRQMKSNGRGEE